MEAQALSTLKLKCIEIGVNSRLFSLEKNLLFCTTHVCGGIFRVYEEKRHTGSVIATLILLVCTCRMLYQSDDSR
jgi:hypothetical protein